MVESWTGTEGRFGTPIRSLSFLDSGRLAVTVVTRAQGNPELARRDEPSAASAFQLNALIIEAYSGRVLESPHWPSNSRFAGIIAVNGKGLLIERGQELTLLSPDLKPVKQLTLPPLPAGEFTSYWSFHASPSGRRVLFFAGPIWTRVRWLWVDAEELQVLSTWEDVLNGSVAVSDDQLILQPFMQHAGDPPTTLMVRVPGGEWHPLPSTLQASNPRFVAPDLLCFSRHFEISSVLPSGVFLMRTATGEASRLEPPHKGWGFGRAATSASGGRFVILLNETSGSHPALDIGGHLVLKGFEVFDPPFSVPTFTLEVKDSRIKNPDIPALSPDGRHIAVLAYPDPVLEVYDLPPAK